MIMKSMQCGDMEIIEAILHKYDVHVVLKSIREIVRDRANEFYAHGDHYNSKRWTEIANTLEAVVNSSASKNKR